MWTQKNGQVAAAGHPCLRKEEGTIQVIQSMKNISAHPPTRCSSADVQQRCLFSFCSLLDMRLTAVPRKASVLPSVGKTLANDSSNRETTVHFSNKGSHTSPENA